MCVCVCVWCERERECEPPQRPFCQIRLSGDSVIQSVTGALVPGGH